MGILLKNGTFIHYDTLEILPCDVMVDEGPDKGIRIIEPSDDPADEKGHTVLDCTGKLITKSFAIGHHHTYSALARGMPPPGITPANFREMLNSIWWSLDKCLDKETIRYSALSTAIAAAKSGATFIIDHHASPNCIKGSLSIIARAFDEVGVNHLLCYEATDRDGQDKGMKGLNESERYLQKGQGLIGLHASFTVGPELLKKAVRLSQKHDTGIHIHLAEDKYDQEHCLQTYYQQVTHRLNEAGVLDLPKTILVHGLHLDARERKMIRNKACWVVENMESNLKNKVGCFNGSGLGDNIMLGTDGMHGDMLRSAKAAFFAGQLHEQISPLSLYRRFRNAHRYLMQNNFSGDGDNNLVIFHYDSPTEITRENLPAHFLFGINNAHITDVIANGKIIVKDRKVCTIDESAVLKEAVACSRKLWEKVSQLRKSS